ncbi:MAG: DUF4339 domain-containing protein [Thermoguttaceae bacterium]
MTSVEWYYARDNKQTGPVSAQELKRLATAGELRPEDLVWREGLTEWSPARNVRGLFDDSAALPTGASGVKIASVMPRTTNAPAVGAGQGDISPVAHPFGLLLNLLRIQFNAQFIESTARVFRTCGSYGLLAAMVMLAAFSVLMAAKTGHLGHLLSGAISITILMAAQYVAERFCEAIGANCRVSSESLASSAVPDSLAVLSIAAGLAALLLSISVAIQTAIYPVILFGVAAFLALSFLAAIALNPGMLGVEIAAGNSNGLQAIGVAAFLMKALLQGVPVAFGAGVLCGALLLGYACGTIFSGPAGLVLAENTAAVARHYLALSAYLPLAAYLVFLLASLLLDFCRAILAPAAANAASTMPPQEKDAANG